MPLIHVERVVKEFSAPRRHPGLLGSLRALVSREQVLTRAVDGNSFSLEEGDLLGYIGQDPASPEVQRIIARWHQHIRYFYEPLWKGYWKVEHRETAIARP